MNCIEKEGCESATSPTPHVLSATTNIFLIILYLRAMIRLDNIELKKEPSFIYAQNQKDQD